MARSVRNSQDRNELFVYATEMKLAEDFIQSVKEQAQIDILELPVPIKNFQNFKQPWVGRQLFS
jgi:hypothetical protein